MEALPVFDYRVTIITLKFIASEMAITTNGNNTFILMDIIGHMTAYDSWYGFVNIVQQGSSKSLGQQSIKDVPLSLHISGARHSESSFPAEHPR